jgi:hypothetical protein
LVSCTLNRETQRLLGRLTGGPLWAPSSRRGRRSARDSLVPCARRPGVPTAQSCWFLAGTPDSCGRDVRRVPGAPGAGCRTGDRPRRRRLAFPVPQRGPQRGRGCDPLETPPCKETQSELLRSRKLSGPRVDSDANRLYARRPRTLLFARMEARRCQRSRPRTLRSPRANGVLRRLSVTFLVIQVV